MFDQIAPVQTAVATKTSTDVGITTSASIAIGLGSLALTGGLFVAALGLGIQKAAALSVERQPAQVQIAGIPNISCGPSGTKIEPTGLTATSTSFMVTTAVPTNCEYMLSGDMTLAWSAMTNATSTYHGVASSTVVAIPGNYVFDARCVDEEGSVLTVSCPLTLRSNTAPTNVVIAGPATVDLGTSNTWTVSYTDPDIDFGQSSYYDILWGDGARSYGYTASASVAHTYTQPGSKVISVMVADGLAQATTSSTVVVTDNVAPVITEVRQSNNIVDVGYSVYWTILATDNSTSLQYRVDWGDGSASALQTANSFGHIYTVLGPKTVRFFATDGNNEVSTTLQINVIDRAEPSIFFTSPSPLVSITYVNTTTPMTVSGTAHDSSAPTYPASGISKVEVRVGTSGAWILATGTTSWTTSVSLLEGINTIYARATDHAGNIAVRSAQVFVDVHPPVVSISSPANNSVVGTSSVYVQGTSGDPVSPASSLGRTEVKVNDGVWSNVGVSAWGTHIALTPGKNTVQARSVDRAGNISAPASIAVYFGRVAPRIGFTRTDFSLKQIVSHRLWLNFAQGQGKIINAQPVPGYSACHNLNITTSPEPTCVSGAYPQGSTNDCRYYLQLNNWSWSSATNKQVARCVIKVDYEELGVTKSKYFESFITAPGTGGPGQGNQEYVCETNAPTAAGRTCISR